MRRGYPCSGFLALDALAALELGLEAPLVGELLLGVVVCLVVVALDLHLAAVAVQQHLHVRLRVGPQLIDQVALSLSLRLELLARLRLPRRELLRGHVEVHLSGLGVRNGHGDSQVFLRVDVDSFEELELETQRPDSLLDLAVEELLLDELGHRVLPVVEDRLDHEVVSEHVALEQQQLADQRPPQAVLQELLRGGAGLGVAGQVRLRVLAALLVLVVCPESTVFCVKSLYCAAGASGCCCRSVRAGPCRGLRRSRRCSR